jgi:ribonuclease HI
MADPVVLTIYTDGASRGNPGEAAFAYTITGEGLEDIEEAGRLGRMTNNQAEYTALVKALEHALELGSEHEVVVHSDSELMVKQMTGEYRVKNGDLRPLYEDALDLARQFRRVRYRHVRRDQNKRTDELCNLVLDGKLLSSVRTLVPKRPSAPSLFQDELASPASLADQATEILHQAAVKWSEGGPRDGIHPSPSEVWEELAKLLQQHGVQLPPAREGRPQRQA